MLWSLEQLSDSPTLGLNEIGSFKIGMVHDGNGRCMRYEESEPFAVEEEEKHNKVEAPRLYLVQENDDKKMKKQLALFPICLGEETFKPSLYTSGKGSLCNFNAQSVVAVMKD